MAAALISACSSRIMPPPQHNGAPEPATPHLVQLDTTAPGSAHQRHPGLSPRPFTELGPCSPTKLPQLPAGSGCASRVVADFDGDGKPDRFIVYAHPLADDGSPQAWHVMILLDNGNGNVRTTDIPNSDRPGNRGVVTAFDANRDGRAEALVVMNEGASNDFSRLYQLWDTRIVPVRDGTGKPFQFDAGGVALEGSGGGCLLNGGVPMVDTTAYWKQDGRYHWQRTFYRWDGVGNLRLTKLHTQHGLTTRRQDGRYGQFTCFDRHLGDRIVPHATY